MNDRVRILVAVGGVFALFLAVQLGALVLVEPFEESRGPAVDDPQDPINSAVFFGVILVATGVMLAAFRYDAQRFVRALLVGVSVVLAWFVFTELVPDVVQIGGVNAIAVAGALAIGLALLVYPEWYVIDLAGVVIGAGAAGLFGISFGLLPAIVFLVGLAIYDAISVYRTEHMLSLADGALESKLPVVFVVPTTLAFSYLDGSSTPASLGTDPTDDVDRDGDEPSGTPDGGSDDESPADEPPSAGERDALFIGLGDAVIPTILVASAVTFLEAPTLDVPAITLTVPALGAIIGTLCGLAVLMHMVLKGRPHAGLPLLNGGAIFGYLVGAMATGTSLATAVGL